MFLGFAVSDAMFERVLDSDRGMPVQTQRFGWSVVRALHRVRVDVDLISAEPVADYPHNSRLLIRGRMFKQESVQGESIPFLNATGLKHLSRYFAGWWVTRRPDRRRPDAILIHGVHSPFLWLGLRLGKSWNIPVVAILTDAPSLVTSFDNPATLALKSADRRLILRALAKMDGVVALAPALGDELAPGRPCLLLEGIASDMPVALFPKRGVGPLTVVYAGGLNESYGVMNLVASVKLSEESWNLRIYGRGPAEREIRIAAEADERVEFVGSVPPQEMAGVYAQADVLVNPRPVHHEIAARSFPSKLLEYLATGVPVVSTDLPTLPADYRDHLIIAESTPIGLARAIDQVVREEPEVRAVRGQAARKFILSTRGSEAQGQALKDFLERVRN